MKKLCFRFDIDTHKCIRDGVPALIELSNEMHVPFTFFLNVGKSISLFDSIDSLLNALFYKSKNKLNKESKLEMMSALQKLGIYDYLYAALINPNLFHYKKQIMQLLISSCEVSLHGGRNHALWHRYASQWTSQKLLEEITWGVNKIRKIDSSFKPKGFASPGWNTPTDLDKILFTLGFSYCADYRNKMGGVMLDINKTIPYIGVNLVGEPGGVAFFENCRVIGMNDNEILMQIISMVNKHEITVLYDHPYYAGMKEIELIKRTIIWAQSNNVQIVKLENLI